jgi:hypothetical protein
MFLKFSKLEVDKILISKHSCFNLKLIFQLEVLNNFKIIRYYKLIEKELQPRPVELNQGSLTKWEGSVQLTSLRKLLYISTFNIEYVIYIFIKTSYLSEEVNCTKGLPL